MSLGKHTAVNLGSATLSLAIAVVTVPIYLGYIGAERYGVLAVLWAMLGYFGFMDLGLGRAVQQRMASQSNAGSEHHSTLVWTAMLATLVLGLIGSAALGTLGYVVLDQVVKMSAASRDEALRAMFWLWAFFPLLLINSVLNGALQARLRFVKSNAIQFSNNALGQLVPLFIAAHGYVELSYLVPATLAIRLATTAWLFCECWREVPLSARIGADRKHLAHLLQYGGWASVTTVLAPILLTIDRLIIGAVSGAQAVAYYTVPYNLVFRTIVIPTSLSNALFPRLARLDDQAGRAMASASARTLMAVMTPLAVVAILLVHPLLGLWLGAEFASQSIGVSELIMFGIWLNATVIPHHARYLATGSPRVVAQIFVLEIPIYIGMLWTGLHLWGIQGAAAAWTLRVLLDSMLLLRLNRVLGETARFIWPSFLLVLAAYTLTFAVHGTAARIALSVLFVFAAIAKDWQLLLAAAMRLRGRRSASIA